MFVSHLENICLFPSADLRLRLFQHSFVSQTLTNDRNDGGALVEDYRRDARENKFNENERRKKKKGNKDSKRRLVGGNKPVYKFDVAGATRRYKFVIPVENRIPRLDRASPLIYSTVTRNNLSPINLLRWQDELTRQYSRRDARDSAQDAFLSPVINILVSFVESFVCANYSTMFLQNFLLEVASSWWSFSRASRFLIVLSFDFLICF